MSAEEDQRRRLVEAEEALNDITRLFQEVDQRKQASAALAGTAGRRRESVAWLQGRDGATISEFSNCLAGLEPTHYVSGVGKHPAERAAKTYADILARSVGISLQATNSSEKPAKQLFRITQLLEVSKRLKLGFADELAAGRSAKPTAETGREGDIARFVDWLVVRLRECGVSGEEFCAQGSMSALYGVYRDHFRKTAPPYSESPFSDRLNRAGFRFGPGARARKARQYVLSTLGAEKK